MSYTDANGREVHPDDAPDGPTCPECGGPLATSRTAPGLVGWIAECDSCRLLLLVGPGPTREHDGPAPGELPF